MHHRLNQIISDYFITQKNKESFLLTNPGKLNQNFLRNFDYWKTHPSKFIFYFRSHWDRLNETVSSSLYLNPHWWILENSSINFYEISITGDYWKTDPSKFPERFLENSSVRVTPRNSLNVIFRLNTLFWMSFPSEPQLILTLLNTYWQPWKTHPEIFPQFRFSGVCHRRNSGKFIQYFFRNSYFGGKSWTDFWKIHPSIFC